MQRHLRQRELLQHPDEDKAVLAEVRKYLSAPGLVAKLANHFKNRVFFDLVVIGGGYETGHVAAAGGAILLTHIYEMVSHSQPAMRILAKVATEKNPRLAARLIVSALSTSMRGGAESALGDNNAGGK